MKMKTNIATYCGFCSGVKNAYNKALELAKKNKPVYMLGLLVHNSLVIQKLKEMGIESVSSVSDIPVGTNGYLLISAHGVGPNIYEEAKKTGLEVIDTTCAWVKKAQTLAKELNDSGYCVFIVGDKNHTEVKGIKAWTNDNAIIIENSVEAQNIAPQKKIGIVAQTTQSADKFDSIVKILGKKTDEIKVHNTICNATSKMQSSAMELTRSSDIIIVIGDQKSANTKRLKELCSQAGVETYQIHDSKELNKSWLKNKNNVGITAGASTPQWVIDEVVNKITS